MSNAICLIRTLESVCIRVYPWFYTAWFRLQPASSLDSNGSRSGVNAVPLLQ